ncbi:hypothetical protein IT398_01985 [Candidatus Nomurabacteria bacterium]|nr:hypothetical protein [Candidatus Nomurabacteria bacterium]
MIIKYFNLQYFYNLIYRLITSPWYLEVPVWFPLVWLLVIIALWIAIVAIALKIYRQRKEESADLEFLLKNKSAEPVEKNDRWEKVLKYLESENPAEWKLAIIEADTMLDDLVKSLKPVGENLGERLKSIEPSDFLTIQEAWDAHKVRNRIAHESDFQLSRHETSRVIGLFRQVFEEFKYI